MAKEEEVLEKDKENSELEELVSAPLDVSKNSEFRGKDSVKSEDLAEDSEDEFLEPLFSPNFALEESEFIDLKPALERVAIEQGSFGEIPVEGSAPPENSVDFAKYNELPGEKYSSAGDVKYSIGSRREYEAFSGNKDKEENKFELDRKRKESPF